MMKWYFAGMVLLALALAAALGLVDATDGTADAPPRAPGASAVADTTRADACTVVRPPTRLARDVRETSGLALGAAGVLWTHNDAGGRPELYGFDTAGRLVAHVAVTGARLTDWEDMDAAPCGQGACLFIGDIGDNDGVRDHVTIYRVPEPESGQEAVPATAYHARYPEGPQDAEGLIATPGGDLFILTKGAHGPVRLYRMPRNRQAGALHPLELVRDVAPRPNRRGNQVSAATASQDGRWAAFRTYDTLYFFAADALFGSAPAAPAATFDLRPLGEPQGEALALGTGGAVWLTSEAEGGGEPFLTGLSCPYGG
ncbi:MAG: hypothetical protein WEB88_06630 [Gemmatimonadota bacterium]